jgi:hypothetical protein
MLDICPECGRKDYLLGQPELPYAGTSGYRGSDTSESRARRDDRDGTTGKRQAETIEALRHAGIGGLTWKELGQEYNWHHGQASGVLSVLHKTEKICRLREARNRCKVYVHPSFLNERETEAHRGSITGRVDNRKEIVMLTERQADVLIDGQKVLVGQVARTLTTMNALPPNEAAERVIATIADWLSDYRPADLGSDYCGPLDMTAFILRKGQVKE